MADARRPGPAEADAGQPDANADSVLGAARGLADTVRACADEAERLRRAPAGLLDALRDAGLFGLCLPASLGGAEIEVPALIETIEAVSQADGSAGWIAMIGATSGVVAAYLPEDAAREVFARGARTAIGGVLAPRGRAVAVDGGYRASGRWAFASGCQHCDWLLGGCAVVEDGRTRLLPIGVPDSRMLVFPASEVQIHDTWHSSGLRGTGSHDIEVRDVWVPASRTAALASERPREPGPLYLFPVFGLLAVGVAAVALGIARSAIDALTALAADKRPAFGRTRLAEKPAAQAEVARAEADLRSARALLLDTAADAWHGARTRGSISLRERALLRVAATHAARRSARAVDRAHDLAGGTSVYTGCPLERHFRDAHTVTQHAAVAPATFELAGRVLLGIETDASML